MPEETEPVQFNPAIETQKELPKTVNISDEDKENFYKSILADKPYEEVVSLFDDRIKLKFKSLTVQENNDVVNQIGVDRKAGLAAETDAYLITIAGYRLALGLVSIDDKPYSNISRDNFTALKDNETYLAARSKPMSLWSTAKMSAFLDAFRTFESKLIKLTSEVQNPNFWKASA